MRCIDKMLNKLSETKPVLIGGTKENGYYHVLLPTALELAVGMINPKEWAKERGVKLGKDFNYCVVQQQEDEPKIWLMSGKRKLDCYEFDQKEMDSMHNSLNAIWQKREQLKESTVKAEGVWSLSRAKFLSTPKVDGSTTGFSQITYPVWIENFLSWGTIGFTLASVWRSDEEWLVQFKSSEGEPYWFKCKATPNCLNWRELRDALKEKMIAKQTTKMSIF